jgi:alkylation response protein AidB-like acyl-CoA dehydrogenase
MTDLLICSEEQQMLGDLAVRVFAGQGNSSSALAESGLLALAFSEADGGMGNGGDCSDLAIAFAAQGHAFAADPLLLQAVLGGGLIAAGAHGDRAAMISGIMTGTERVAAALLEPGCRSNVTLCETAATRTADGWRIDGCKTMVLGASESTRIVLTARIAGEGPGLALFLADPAGPGIKYRNYTLRDGTPASDLTFIGAELPAAALILGAAQAPAALDRVMALAQLCLAAEASGIAGAALSATGAYVDQRQQFGKAIGSFQVIQHRLADMAVLSDQTAALVAEAAAHGNNSKLSRGTHRIVAEMGLSVAKSAIQLHGGYGMTEDLPFGRALRRMMTIALLF